MATDGGAVGSSTALDSDRPAKRVKLTGRAFYESLGSPKMILAPMVDQSEFAWRMLTRSFMNESKDSKPLLAYSPMLHARLFAETQKFRSTHFQPVREVSHAATDAWQSTDKPYLDGNPGIDRPLFVQFCANDPDELLNAAKYVESYCDAVDLNLGCPQGIARKGKYGAFLQEDWDLVYKLIHKLHRELKIPVTAKIRILETKEKTLEYAKTILSAGASILTVHGRLREQKSHMTGLADWCVIRYLRDNLPRDTVLFANGNILQHEDIQKCLDATGVDGVMSAEGNLHDPTIFAAPPPLESNSREYWQGRNGKGGWRVDAIFRRYMEIIYRYVLETSPPERKPLFISSDGPESSIPDRSPVREELEEGPARKKVKREGRDKNPLSPSLLSMQAHLFHLLRPLVSKHTNVRDRLAKCRAWNITSYEEVLQMTEAAVREGLLHYDQRPEEFEQDNTILDPKVLESSDESSLATVQACKRPWWVCQPYVRPLPKEALQKGSMTMSKKDLKKMKTEKSDTSDRGPSTKVSERERLDLESGVPEVEMPKQAMVAG